jgi:hypothetical protein
LLTAVVESGLTGVLFDLPPVVARARVPAGVEVVGGDFVEGVPEGGDAYILSRVLHNWVTRQRHEFFGGAVRPWSRDQYCSSPRLFFPNAQRMLPRLSGWTSIR